MKSKVPRGNVKGRIVLSLLNRLDRSGILKFDMVDIGITRQSR
jgi:hypothetical protein